MDDLIRRSDVNFPDAQKPDINGELTDFQCGYNTALSKMKTRLSNVHAVDAVEVKHGEWIERDVFPAKGNVDMLQSAFCPNCKRYHTTPYSYYFTNYEYCPHCGARMDGGTEE